MKGERATHILDEYKKKQIDSTSHLTILFLHFKNTCIN